MHAIVLASSLSSVHMMATEAAACLQVCFNQCGLQQVFDDY